MSKLFFIRDKLAGIPINEGIFHTGSLICTKKEPAAYLPVPLIVAFEITEAVTERPVYSGLPVPALTDQPAARCCSCCRKPFQ